MAKKVGGDGDDQLIGSSDADQLIGNGGDDLLDGGDGDDQLYGNLGEDELNGGAGNDELDGGEDNDRLSGGIGNDKLTGWRGDDILEGGDGDDRLYGNAGADQLDGGAGNDQLFGGVDDDLLSGGAGDDDLDGGYGDDRISGGAGNDKLTGDRGDDHLDGGDGDDRLYGNMGNDELYGGAGNDKLDGGVDNDLLSGGDGNDELVGYRGDDRLDGGDGADRLYGNMGNDELYGGAGNDKLYGGVDEDLLSGGDGDDELDGGYEDDWLGGGAGDDKLWGNRGDDYLEGGEGDDQLYGNLGKDELNGGAGNDRLDGGYDDDLFTYRTGDGSDVIDGGHGGGDTIRLEVADGWILNLTSGRIVSDSGGHTQLSGSSSGTIQLDDGSTISFKNIERIEAVVTEPDDDNLPPIGLSLVAEPVEENAPDGSIVGTAEASDPDAIAALSAGGGLAYSLTDDADGRFAIDPNSGVVTVVDGSRLDFESASQHSVEIAVTDSGGLSTTQTFTIAVADVNEAPSILGLSADQVSEDAAGGTVIGTVRASDPDTGDTLTYSLTDDAGGRFVIDPDTGVITVAEGGVLDHESAPQHSVEVEVTDAGGLSTTSSFIIAVADANEAPEGLTLSATVVSEEAAGGAVIGTVGASDPDAGDTLTYSLTDDAGGRFAIDPDTGVITVAEGAVLDHESAPQHGIEVAVTDAGGLSVTKAFTIVVSDVNEAPGGLDLSANQVSEGAAGGTVIGTVGASDPDTGETLTYSLTDDAGGRFVIDPDTGVITVAEGGMLDHESAPQHSVEVEVTDAGGLSTTRAFTIAVIDVNEAPEGLTLSASVVVEGAGAGTVVGTAGASDPNAGDTLTYSLTDDAGGRFVIDADTGVITVADGASLDHESASQHGIEVEVIDAGGLSATSSFTISVADANEAPHGLTLSATMVGEDAAGGTVIGTVGASDPDAGDTLTYSLTDDAGGRFAIDSDTGVITVAEGTVLDHESAPQHGIEIAVTDAGGLSFTKAFTIVVGDVNEAPSVLDLSANQVSEDAAGGTVIGTVGASDPDAGDTLIYSLTDDAGGRFVIDPDTGVITVADGAALDYQSAAQHDVEVAVTDAGGLSATKSFTIAVGEANHAPEGVGLSTAAVAENASTGTVVGSVSATDPNSGDTLTYSLTDDADGRFVIDPDTGVITVADGAALDHESASQHSIEVEVTDAGGLSTTKAFTIAVTDVNEAPDAPALDASEVAEGAGGGTVVGTVSAADPDAGDTLTHSLTDDAGGRFVIDPDTGVITVADGVALDHESASQHGIEVAVTDAGGLSTTKAFTIVVTDVNEAPDAPALDTSEVAEGAGGGTVVGTVSAADPDAGDTLTYSLTDDAGGRFVIDPDTGVITVADGAALDHESASQHGIEVAVTDAGGLSATKSFTIVVTDVNETPGVLALDASQVAEGAGDGTVVGTVSAADPDVGDTLTYSLTDDARGRFVIDPDTGVITVADGAALDHESASQHGIEVAVTDAGGFSTTKAFTIAVTNVNETPSVLDLSANQVAEQAVGGTVVGAVGASDPDAGDTLIYSLTEDAGGRFVIDPDTGVISVADGAALDYGDAAQHEVEVKVTDAGGLSASQGFTIEVTNVNAAPSIQALSADQVQEGAAGGTVIGSVGATDPDIGDTLSFALTDDANGRFVIDPGTGVITVANGAPLDYEAASQHSIEVTVTDAEGLGTGQTFTINVTDVNEAPGALSLDSSEIAEDADGGDVVGTISASDPDAGDALSYGLSDDAGGRFAIDPDTGVITVADGAVLDYDSAPEHSIEVEVTDAGGLSTSQRFTIEVANVNNTPDILGLSASEVEEGAALGIVVGAVGAIDPDVGDSLTYGLSDDAGGRFAIDPDTGMITVADGTLLDYESATEHSIEVEVTDPGGLTASQVFTIAVTNVNEAPSIEGLDASEVAEGSVEGTVVGGVGASDPDAGEMLSYALIDDADGRFVIDPDTGVISVAAGATLDYENAMQHGIEVEVTDAGGLSASQVFAIDVTNVNEQPAIQELSANSVIEGATDGTVIGAVAAFDADGDSGLAFELTDDAQGRFAIDPATGVITVADGTLLDYDDASQHSVEVTVTDPGGLSDVATYVIELHKDNSGNDALTGDDGDNVLDGGPGDDIFHGGNGNDHLIGGPGDDFMFGENDDDLLDGDDGNDQMFGGRGADRLNGGDGADEMFGNAGDDILIGGDGADLLYGDADNDVLVGGAGDDVLRGGDGADRFVFESPDDGLDVILDFASDDVLAIGDMLVGFADGAEAAFVRLVDDGSATTVEVDVDGAANGESYQPIVVLDAITGTSLEDLVSAGQIDFWLS